MPSNMHGAVAVAAVPAHYTLHLRIQRCAGLRGLRNRADGSDASPDAFVVARVHSMAPGAATAVAASSTGVAAIAGPDLSSLTAAPPASAAHAITSRHRSADPCWSADCTLPLPGGALDWLSLSVCDATAFSSSSSSSSSSVSAAQRAVIGAVLIPLADVVDGAAVDRWFDLQLPSASTVSSALSPTAAQSARKPGSGIITAVSSAWSSSSLSLWCPEAKPGDAVLAVGPDSFDSGESLNNSSNNNLNHVAMNGTDPPADRSTAPFGRIRIQMFARPSSTASAAHCTHTARTLARWPTNNNSSNRTHAAASAALAFPEERTQLRLHVITWNVGNAALSSDLRPLLPASCFPSSSSAVGAVGVPPPPDVIAIGLQECSWSTSGGGGEGGRDLSGEPLLHGGSASSCEASVATSFARLLGPGYVRVRMHSLGQMRLLLFVTSSLAPSVRPGSLTCDGVATGVGGVLANKGLIVLSLVVRDTRLAFVSGHLAAHTDKLAQRNDDLASVAKAIDFTFPDLDASATNNNGAATNTQRRPPQHAPPALCDFLSSFHHVFLFGDLNYRLAHPSAPLARTPSPAHFGLTVSMVRSRAWEALASNMDQLRSSQARGEALVDFREEELKFAPSFKVLRGVQLAYNQKRNPSWCDRILWRSVFDAPTFLQPSSHGTVTTTNEHAATAPASSSSCCAGGIVCTSSRSVLSLLSSDHKPVVSSLELPVFWKASRHDLSRGAAELSWKRWNWTINANAAVGGGSSKHNAGDSLTTTLNVSPSTALVLEVRASFLVEPILLPWSELASSSTSSSSSSSSALSLPTPLAFNNRERLLRELVLLRVFKASALSSGSAGVPTSAVPLARGMCVLHSCGASSSSSEESALGEECFTLAAPMLRVGGTLAFRLQGQALIRWKGGRFLVSPSASGTTAAASSASTTAKPRGQIVASGMATPTTTAALLAGTGHRPAASPSSSNHSSTGTLARRTPSQDGAASQPRRVSSAMAAALGLGDSFDFDDENEEEQERQSSQQQGEGMFVSEGGDDANIGVAPFLSSLRVGKTVGSSRSTLARPRVADVTAATGAPTAVGSGSVAPALERTRTLTLQAAHESLLGSTALGGGGSVVQRLRREQSALYAGAPSALIDARGVSALLCRSLSTLAVVLAASEDAYARSLALLQTRYHAPLMQLASMMEAAISTAQSTPTQQQRQTVQQQQKQPSARPSTPSRNPVSSVYSSRINSALAAYSPSAALHTGSYSSLTPPRAERPLRSAHPSPLLPTPFDKRAFLSRPSVLASNLCSNVALLRPLHTLLATRMDSCLGSLTTGAPSDGSDAQPSLPFAALADIAALLREYLPLLSVYRLTLHDDGNGMADLLSNDDGSSTDGSSPHLSSNSIDEDAARVKAAFLSRARAHIAQADRAVAAVSPGVSFASLSALPLQRLASYKLWVSEVLRLLRRGRVSSTPGADGLGLSDLVASFEELEEQFEVLLTHGIPHFNSWYRSVAVQEARQAEEDAFALMRAGEDAGGNEGDDNRRLEPYRPDTPDLAGAHDDRGFPTRTMRPSTAAVLRRPGTAAAAGGGGFTTARPPTSYGLDLHDNNNNDDAGSGCVTSRSRMLDASFTAAGDTTPLDSSIPPSQLHMLSSKVAAQLRTRCTLAGFHAYTPSGCTAEECLERFRPAAMASSNDHQQRQHQGIMLVDVRNKDGRALTMEDLDLRRFTRLQQQQQRLSAAATASPITGHLESLCTAFHVGSLLSSGGVRASAEHWASALPASFRKLQAGRAIITLVDVRPLLPQAQTRTQAHQHGNSRATTTQQSTASAPRFPSAITAAAAGAHASLRVDPNSPIVVAVPLSSPRSSRPSTAAFGRDMDPAAEQSLFEEEEALQPVDEGPIQIPVSVQVQRKQPASASGTPRARAAAPAAAVTVAAIATADSAARPSSAVRVAAPPSKPAHPAATSTSHTPTAAPHASVTAPRMPAEPNVMHSIGTEMMHKVLAAAAASRHPPAVGPAPAIATAASSRSLAGAPANVHTPIVMPIRVPATIKAPAMMASAARSFGSVAAAPSSRPFAAAGSSANGSAVSVSLPSQQQQHAVPRSVAAVAPNGSRPSSAHRSAAAAASSSTSARPSSSTPAAAAPSIRMGHGHGSTLLRPLNPLTLSTALGSAAAAPLSSSHGHVRQNSGGSARSDLAVEGDDGDAAAATALGGPGFVLRPSSSKRASHSLTATTGSANGSRPGSRGV